MWIRPDSKKDLKKLTKEVKSALSKFKKDKAAGKLTPFNDTDVKNWL